MSKRSKDCDKVSQKVKIKKNLLGAKGDHYGLNYLELNKKHQNEDDELIRSSTQPIRPVAHDVYYAKESSRR